MPMHYRYDESMRRLFTRCYGTLCLEDVIAHFRELTTLSRLQPKSDVLLDLMFLTGMPPTASIDQAARVLEELSDFLQFGRCAVVAPDGVPREVANRFQAVSWPLFGGIRIFATSGDAAKWLDQKATDAGR